MYKKSLLSAGVLCALAMQVSVASAKDHDHGLHQQGPFDLAIANESRLIQMLKESGKIDKSANIEDASAYVNRYLAERRQTELHRIEMLSSEDSVEPALKQSLVNKKQFKKHKKAYRKFRRKLLNFFNKRPPRNMREEEWEGDTQTAKVLAILIEFPDFPHNSIIPESTDMYYEDYSRQHFQDLLFSDTGYEGPNAEQGLVSMKQFYEAQSAGAYSVEGSVAGWYMATQPAAFYGGNETGDDRALIREALLAADADPDVNLQDYDIEDRYDLDGDGNYWEPDGLVDHVMVFHSAVGEEAGGGQLGEDAVWSHRWNLGQPLVLTTGSDTEYWGGQMAAYDYTVQPASGAGGVVTHEYAHDLGLPDEYDTEYSGAGEPVASWSIMSSGSWAGVIPGTEPTGFGAYMKEELQRMHGGNWFKGDTVHADDLTKWDQIFLIDQAVSKGRNNDGIRIDLPDKETVVMVPYSGEQSYFSGSDNNLNNALLASVDLTDSTTATLSFATQYDIEADWDYAFVSVTKDGETVTVPGDITTTNNPNGQNPGHGITGASDGWTMASFDLSSFVGSEVQVGIHYVTDGYVANPGMYVDNVVIESDGVALVNDVDESQMTASGFAADSGKFYTEHYYLVEWRTHQGVDAGLANINVSGQMLPYEEGLLMWYVDKTYAGNHVGIHPGYGFVGVVDMDQELMMWSDGRVGTTRYQIHDATMSLTRRDKMVLDFTDSFGIFMEDTNRKAIKVFKDSRSYLSEEMPDAGKYLQEYGIKVKLWSQSYDKTVAKVGVSRKIPRN